MRCGAMGSPGSTSSFPVEMTTTAGCALTRSRAMPADAAYDAGPYKGALTPPPVEAMNKVYPTCTRTLRDSCRNPGGK